MGKAVMRRPWIADYATGPCNSVEIARIRANKPFDSIISLGAAMETQTNLLNEAHTAQRAAVEALARDQASLMHTLDEMNDAIRDGIRGLRECRMACTSEVQASLTALRDIRAFFLDKDYEKERARLADFVDVCERLVALQKSGALDAVADVSLKLSEVSNG